MSQIKMNFVTWFNGSILSLSSSFVHEFLHAGYTNALLRRDIQCLVINNALFSPSSL